MGLVSHLGTESLSSGLVDKYPEIVYHTFSEDGEGIEKAISLSQKHAVTLIGSGSGNTDFVRQLTGELLSTEGGALILDADAINAIALLGQEGIALIKNSKRKLVLTPHPLEFARLMGEDVQIQEDEG